MPKSTFILFGVVRPLDSFQVYILQEVKSCPDGHEVPQKGIVNFCPYCGAKVKAEKVQSVKHDFSEIMPHLNALYEEEGCFEDFTIYGDVVVSMEDKRNVFIGVELGYVAESPGINLFSYDPELIENTRQYLKERFPEWGEPSLYTSVF